MSLARLGGSMKTDEPMNMFQDAGDGLILRKTHKRFVTQKVVCRRAVQIWPCMQASMQPVTQTHQASQCFWLTSQHPSSARTRTAMLASVRIALCSTVNECQLD